MPDDFDDTQVRPTGANKYDLKIERWRAIRDIFNDYRIVVPLMLCVLLAVGALTSSNLIEIIEALGRAWRGEP